ncbi:unnamed protein product [Heligmosomoides polygyrus]|uniref:Uncharacterized protein n=1 Tax=Heligmosomoides polygyrus TaxID=6339 RepID=A0A3P7X8R6_HELPZ|nr:unnamed protein product [Heligmosomoides polygyrus]
MLVDHVRLANQLRSTAASCGEFNANGMVDVVLYTDEQPDKQPARFCSKRRISGGCADSPVKIVRHLRDQLENTNVFRKIQILEEVRVRFSPLTLVVTMVYVCRLVCEFFSD